MNVVLGCDTMWSHTISQKYAVSIFRADWLQSGYLGCNLQKVMVSDDTQMYNILFEKRHLISRSECMNSTTQHFV
jgi:hypothetical protein